MEASGTVAAQVPSRNSPPRNFAIAEPDPSSFYRLVRRKAEEHNSMRIFHEEVTQRWVGSSTSSLPLATASDPPARRER